MTEDEFVRLVGATLAHVTDARNLPGIERAGLLRPATLARLAGLDAGALALRAEPLVLRHPGGVAVLNHQNPLRAGRGADFLDGATIEGWAAQLDERVFLWPGAAAAGFAASVAARGASVVLVLDARRAFQALGPALDLAPINTGSATRRPARRGPWIYTPVAASVAAFREGRRGRGLVRGLDAVVEVSARDDVGPGLLGSLLVEVRGAGRAA